MALSNNCFPVGDCPSKIENETNSINKMKCLNMIFGLVVSLIYMILFYLNETLIRYKYKPVQQPRQRQNFSIFIVVHAKNQTHSTSNYFRNNFVPLANGLYCSSAWAYASQT